MQRGFARLFLGKVKRSPEDRSAEFRILGNQPDGEYAAADYEDCSIWRWVGKRGGEALLMGCGPGRSGKVLPLLADSGRQSPCLQIFSVGPKKSC
jgi:hypothetical protein